MNIKLHRLIVGSSGNQGFGSGATWIVGGAIILCASSLTVFSDIGTSVLVLLLNIPLIILFYLSCNFPKLHYVLGYFFGVLGTYYLLIATPDFFSTNNQVASHGLYHYLVGLYYVGVAYFQYKSVNKNSNKPLKQDK